MVIRATLAYEDLALTVLIETAVQGHMLIIQIPLLLLWQSVSWFLLAVSVLVHSAETGAEQTVFFFVIGDKFV